MNFLTECKKGIDEKIADAVEALATIPGVTREQASALVHNGVHRLEDLLSAEASDISDIPQVGENAAAILEAARAEAGRRTLSVGETPVIAPPTACTVPQPKYSNHNNTASPRAVGLLIQPSALRAGPQALRGWRLKWSCALKAGRVWVNASDRRLNA